MDLPRHHEPHCSRCAAIRSAGQPCLVCQQHAFAFDETCAAFRFDYPLTHWIHAYKYRGMFVLGRWFANELLPCVEEIHARQPLDQIIGMPLHPLRQAERGFNQSHEIARFLAAWLGLPCRTARCVRRYHTVPQVELDASARQHQRADLFEYAGDLSGQHILLVDDVMTTGASLHTLALAMRRQGAERVTCAVLARAT